MQKYLITGYAGCVGYHFINYLNNISKEKVLVLGIDLNEPADFSEWKFDNLELIHKSINLLDFNTVFDIVSEFKPTHILHLAALSSVGKSWKAPAECFSNNTGIFLNLCEAIRIASISCRILCVGSSEEYGFIEEKQLPLKEEMKIIPSNPYAVTKLAQESMSYVYSSGFNMDIICTRSFNHIGPRQRDVFVVASFAKQIAQAAIEGKTNFDMMTGNLNVVRDFLDVRDVVKAYYLLLQKGKPGETYNVCSGEGVPLNIIIKELAHISGIKIITKTNPDLVRPNDIPKIIGNNQKLVNNTDWKRDYTLHNTLNDTYNYWKELLSR